MPHSSGGGSHGGGFHGGSHHSSGHSNFSSQSSFRSHPRISTKRYSGAKEYVYYGKGGQRTYYYSNLSQKYTSPFGSIIGIILSTVITIILISIFMEASVFKPIPLDLHSYQSNIVIEDHLNILNNKELEESLIQFQNTTGVTPAILCVSDSSWKNSYSDIEQYAYAEYLTRFEDEKHWLFVISYPITYQSDEFIDWSWIGMIGDDCDSVINTQSEDTLTQIFHTSLLRSTNDTVSLQIANAFTTYTETVMEEQVDTDYYYIIGFIIIAYIFILIKLVPNCIMKVKFSKSTSVPNHPIECKCEYCDTSYIAGTVYKCPNCNAPIPALNSK